MIRQITTRATHALGRYTNDEYTDSVEALVQELEYESAAFTEARNLKVMFEDFAVPGDQLLSLQTAEQISAQWQGSNDGPKVESRICIRKKAENQLTPTLGTITESAARRIRMNDWEWLQTSPAAIITFDCKVITSVADYKEYLAAREG